MARIGYMEGTDPEVLDKLALKGHELIPLGDESDGYAKNLFHVTRLDRIDIVITRFYKLRQLSGSYGISISLSEILNRCQEANTFVIVTAPGGVEGEIKKLFENKGIAERVNLVPHKSLYEEVVSSLKSQKSQRRVSKTGS